jgi:hypothetical protein
VNTEAVFALCTVGSKKLVILSGGVGSSLCVSHATWEPSAAQGPPEDDAPGRGGDGEVLGEQIGCRLQQGARLRFKRAGQHKEVHARVLSRSPPRMLQQDHVRINSLACAAGMLSFSRLKFVRM